MAYTLYATKKYIQGDNIIFFLSKRNEMDAIKKIIGYIFTGKNMDSNEKQKSVLLKLLSLNFITEIIFLRRCLFQII